MKNEKILKYAVMDEEELDQVAGGTYLETMSDGEELYKRGLLDKRTFRCAPIREVLKKLGYTGYQDDGGFVNGNIYTDKKGNMISREKFWENFDAENGTKIIR